MRKYFIAGNWKMNFDAKETLQYSRSFKVKGLEKYDVDMLLCPPFTSISTMVDILKTTPLKVGGQTMHHEVKGAYTGEISAEMLINSGCEWVLIGHSERRQYFGETDSSVNVKTRRALEAGISPMVCIGESLEERQANVTNNVISTQLNGAFDGFTAEMMKKVVIAYEPVWAIGTGLTATPAQAQDVHAFIRAKIKEDFGSGISDSIRILYGGSAKVDNADSLLREEDIDGLLIGGASLKVDDFTEIIDIAHNL